jgi:thioredoxin-like negative regulator of GroEL
MIFLRLLVLGMIGLFAWDGPPKPALSVRDNLWHHRNLGKAYYENPMTQLKAVEEFKLALDLAPQSPRDQVNYGLALLRAGMTKEAILQLQKAQKAGPTIPHTWFNLGMAYKKEFENEQAIEQLQGMLKLVPDEPTTHYNLGVLYKLTGKAGQALAEFKTASQISPNFAAPHFQLYNTFRESGQKEEAARELTAFNEIKKRKAGAAVPEDPEWNSYAEIYDTAELDAAYDRGTNSPGLKYQITEAHVRVNPNGAGMIVLDVNGKGEADLLVWSESGVSILNKGAAPVSNTGLENLKGVISIAAGDFNNDGLPDLAVITKSGAILYVNHAGHFEESPIKLPQGEFTKAVWVDYDHDYDLDLLLLGRDSVLLRNDGTAGFSNQTSHFPFVHGRALDAAVFEMVADTGTSDIAMLYEDGSIVIYHDKLLGQYESLPQAWHVPEGASIQALDIDNDGWMDLAVASPAGVQIIMNDHGKLTSGGKIKTEKGLSVFADIMNRSLNDLIATGGLFRNLGNGKFEKAPDEPMPEAVALSQADFDGSGVPQLAAIQKNGSIAVIKPISPENNSYIAVHLEGVKNLKVPLGAIVEVKAGAWYQKKVYAGVPLVFGLRANAEIDTVRITWPNGLVQNEIKPSSGKYLSFKEKARLSGSCPMIFAWNGAKFGFVTDVLGVAPLGASNGDGVFFPVNHREHILIPSEALKMQDEQYEIRITEELREVTYLDKVQLIAVDHKADMELFLNDKFKAPPFPPFRVYEVKQKIYPVSAKDNEQHDVLGRLLQRDGKYVDNFRRNNAGVGELHSLTLDFGEAAKTNRAQLVLTGWVDWPDGSTFLAAAQEHKDGLIFPYLQVKDSAGNWVKVDSDMGMPSGKPKSIVVDLSGKFLSQSREVRIVTNLCVYWDEIFLSEDTAAPAIKMLSLATKSADLHYRGFSQVHVQEDRTQPEQFEYEHWIPVSMWNPTPGMYTRYGEVRSLLQEADDRFAILGSGDELRFLFDAKTLPELPPNWKRDFILLVDGWAKDSDANTAYAKSVGPLPFHGMKRYPYAAPQQFPSDPAHKAYQKNFNTRTAVQDLSVLRPH